MSNRTKLFVGRDIRHFESLNSTNLYAQELLSKSTPIDGTVISTYDQYAGRGQLDSRWESQPGKNLSLSIILYPTFLLPSQQFKLSQAISIGVRNFMARFVPDDRAVIKWPNDIYVGQRKIAGILIQNTLTGKRIQSTIVGIGINVNQKQFSERVPNPTSLTIETGKEFQLDEIIPLLLSNIESAYLLLKNGDWVDLQNDYLQHFYRVNELASYKDQAGQPFQGTISGVSAAGHLIVQSDGVERRFAMKEITFV